MGNEYSHQTGQPIPEQTNQTIPEQTEPVPSGTTYR